MAKISRYIKGQQTLPNTGGHASFEQNESYDDNVLPSAEELARLKDLEPNIILWIMERGSKEQDSRLAEVEKKWPTFDRLMTFDHRVDMSILLCAFVLSMVGLISSYSLIINDKSIAGSIFGGITLFVAIQAILNFRRNN